MITAKDEIKNVKSQIGVMNVQNKFQRNYNNELEKKLKLQSNTIAEKTDLINQLKINNE